MLYLCLILSVLARFAGGIWQGPGVLELSGALWMLAFAGFAVLCGPALMDPRPGR